MHSGEQQLNRTRTALAAAVIFLLLGGGLGYWLITNSSVSTPGEPPAPTVAAPAPTAPAPTVAPPTSAAASGDGGTAVRPARPEPPGTPGPPPAFKPGRYQVTSRQLNKVARGQSQGPFVDEQCLLAEDPAPRGHVPPGCRHFDYRTDGNTFTWRIRCMGSRMGDGVGTATISADGQSVEAKLRLWLPAIVTTAPMRYDQEVIAKRVGECE